LRSNVLQAVKMNKKSTLPERLLGDQPDAADRRLDPGIGDNAPPFPGAEPSSAPKFWVESGGARPRRKRARERGSPRRSAELLPSITSEAGCFGMQPRWSRSPFPTRIQAQTPGRRLNFRMGDSPTVFLGGLVASGEIPSSRRFSLKSASPRSPELQGIIFSPQRNAHVGD
jgi:hypothetical protein